MRAGVEPGVAAAHFLDTQRAAREVGFVDIGDFELATRRWLDVFRDVDDVLVVKVEASDGVVRARMSRLFFEAECFPLFVKFDNAVALGVADVVSENGGTFVLRGGMLHGFCEVGAVEDVITEHEGATFACDEIFANQERLREAVRARLDGVTDGNAELAAVAEERGEKMRILRRRDDEDVIDAREHESRERVINHRLVINRHELL